MADGSKAMQAEETGRKRKWPKRLGFALAALVLVCALAFGGFAWYASDYYRDADASHDNLRSKGDLQVSKGPGYIAFGSPKAATGFIFYPGAKVEPSSYAPLLREIAGQGYLCIVDEMPFNFAFLNIGAASSVMADYPQVEHWWIGGHSLGGSMAASYAAGQGGRLDGLVLLGSYSAEDLSGSGLEVLSIRGENDAIVDEGKVEENAPKLPADARTLIISGGNHAGFGNYGAQTGDGTASITQQEQWAQTAAAIVEAFSV